MKIMKSSRRRMTQLKYFAFTKTEEMSLPVTRNFPVSTPREVVYKLTENF